MARRAPVKIDTLQVDGQKFPYTFNTETRLFEVSVKGDELVSSNLDDLERRIQEHLQKSEKLDWRRVITVTVWHPEGRITDLTFTARWLAIKETRPGYGTAYYSSNDSENCPESAKGISNFSFRENLVIGANRSELCFDWSKDRLEELENKQRLIREANTRMRTEMIEWLKTL